MHSSRKKKSAWWATLRSRCGSGQWAGGGPLKWHLESGACRHCAALSDSLHAIVERFSNRHPERLTCTVSRDTSKGHMTEHPSICTFWSPKHFYVHSPPLLCRKTPARCVASPTPIRHAEAWWHSQWTLRSLHERFYCCRNWCGGPRRNRASVVSHVRLD